MHTKIFSSLLLFVIGLSSTTLGSIVIGTTFTEYRNVAYNLSPGQVMDIYVPTGKKLNPTIILIHGGAWIGGDKLDLSTIAGLLVREGFTVANINYRLATVDSNQYPAAVKDAESVVEWLQSNAAAYRVDTSRIAAFGTSAGANLALTLGTFNRVKAVVDFYGPTDFTDPAFWADSLNGVSNSQILDLYLGLAIRYAVDNGARVINMSFGKYFSPGKKWVDDAIQYAAEHDVLLVHAAGNESRNIDSISHYPVPEYDAGGRNSCCFITVGANAGGPDSLVLARFSNYGKKQVDLFAPGVKVYSALPGNQYATYSGTSMAAPMVSGIAALLLEYYPQLSARQLKYILMKSVMKLPQAQVKWAVTGSTIDFNQLSVTGGIVNAYDALRLAASIKGERKNPNKTRIRGFSKD